MIFLWSKKKSHLHISFCKNPDAHTSHIPVPVAYFGISGTEAIALCGYKREANHLRQYIRISFGQIKRKSTPRIFSYPFISELPFKFFFCVCACTHFRMELCFGLKRRNMSSCQDGECSNVVHWPGWCQVCEIHLPHGQV